MCLLCNDCIVTTYNEANKRIKPHVLIPEETHGFQKMCFILYYLVVCFTVMSWTSEVLFGKSLMERFVPRVVCPTILRANTSLEVIKAIGLSSAFIMLVINAADKRVFGVRYSEIIQKRFPHYWICSVIHVIFTLGGIASGIAGASEATLAALFIVVFGLLIQWQVVFELILSKESREMHADSIWEDQIKNPESAQGIYFVLQQLASEIAQYSGHIPMVLLNRFTDALIVFSVKESSDIKVAQLAGIWSTILHGKPEINEDNLIGKIFAACINYKEVDSSKRSNALVKICGGLLVYQIRREVTESTAEDVESKLAEVARKIGRMTYQIPEITPSVEADLKDHIHMYMCTFFMVVAWVAFFRGGIRLNADILCLKTFAAKEMCKECKECAREAVSAIFPIVDDCNANKLDELVEKSFMFTIRASGRK